MFCWFILLISWRFVLLIIFSFGRWWKYIQRNQTETSKRSNENSSYAIFFIADRYHAIDHSNTQNWEHKCCNNRPTTIHCGTRHQCAGHKISKFFVCIWMISYDSLTIIIIILFIQHQKNAHKCSTWGDTEGKYFYDCENDAESNRLTPINQPLTNDQRLQQYLLQEQKYEPTIAPFDLKVVMLNFDLANANFNAKKSILESRGRFRAVNLCSIEECLNFAKQNFDSFQLLELDWHSFSMECKWIWWKNVDSFWSCCNASFDLDTPDSLIKVWKT